MLAYTVRRLPLIIPVMLVVATTVFLLLYLTPGDPVGVILGPDATEQQRAELRERLGLDQPAHVQLLRWYGRLVQGDLGSSIFLNKTVTAAFLERLEPTMMLTLLAFSFAFLLGGAVISEQIFNIPGVGRLLIQSVSRRDYPLVQGVLMIIAAIYMSVNLIVDLTYAYLDPGIRHSA